MQKVSNEIRENHLMFISDDKKHDVPFIEKCIEIFHDHYVEEGLQINHNIEYNDGCSSQFKCIRAFSSLARRPVKTTRIFCETNHRKSKSDGLAGVVKAFGSRAVCSERCVIRDAKELTDLFDKTLEVKSAIESNRPMLKRLFFYISLKDMEDYRSVFPSLKYNYISGTLSIHEVVTIPENMEAILYRKASCGYSCCLSGNYKECVCLEQFQQYPDLTQMVKHRFSLKNGNASEREEDVDNDLDEDEQIEWDKMFIETEASKHIQEGDVAVIKTGDDHPYYLLKVTSLFKTKAETTDNYRHTSPPAHWVVEGPYLEIYKENQ